MSVDQYGAKRTPLSQPRSTSASSVRVTDTFFVVGSGLLLLTTCASIDAVDMVRYRSTSRQMFVHDVTLVLVVHISVGQDDGKGAVIFVSTYSGPGCAMNRSIATFLPVFMS
jgi:hypothetical protein